MPSLSQCLSGLKCLAVALATEKEQFTLCGVCIYYCCCCCCYSFSLFVSLATSEHLVCVRYIVNSVDVFEVKQTYGKNCVFFLRFACVLVLIHCAHASF